MICTKEAHAKCPYKSMCDVGDEVTDDSECAGRIMKAGKGNERHVRDLGKAANTIEELSADRDAWRNIADAVVRDLHSVIKRVDEGCQLCAYYHPCAGKDCPKYISGTGATNPDGTEDPNFSWSCEDFDFGTCPALENTPCNGCDFENHWEWRGPCKENEGGNA